ncbi:MAG: hypothetical protein CMM47_07545 [Rhodospirillaceae bacterium]|nr:hypothetical protein [Rhodospirillaceae bacterium]
MALEIIGSPRSNFVRTVRMVALEKGLTYEHVPEAPHSDMVKALHPLGLIPAMRHDGLELFESAAIVRYIDMVFEGPKLIPEDPKVAAVVNQWCSFVQTSVDRLFLRRYVVEYMFHKDTAGNVVRDEIDRAVKRFPKMFGVLDNAVKPGFLGRSVFSAADCFMMPILAAVQRFPEGVEAMQAASNLTAYFEKVSARPSFAETAV